MPAHELQFHLCLDSRFENIELVQVVVNDSLERLGLEDETRHWVDLAVREAVANAIKHGNRQAADKKVEVDLAVEGADLVVRIADRGEGFDPEEVNDPRTPENLLRPNGRGLFYMRSFMDRVDYAPRDGGGTVVTLRKQLFLQPDSGGDG
ncbi:MAG TPA: ATP-binding protein [Thermoanaerobaculia bacterium]|nr:ATP-binding protein [Thermoanaerobaculia bacterium]